MIGIDDETLLIKIKIEINELKKNKTPKKKN